MLVRKPVFEESLWVKLVVWRVWTWAFLGQDGAGIL